MKKKIIALVVVILLGCVIGGWAAKAVLSAF